MSERTCEERLAFIVDVLSMLDSDNGLGDLDESVFRMVRDGNVTFMVNANDLFYWACADGEEITPDNIAQLRQAITDVRLARGLQSEPRISESREEWEWWYHAGHLGAELFCCRVRGMRPQRPCYKSIPDDLRPLFDACGPERDPKEEG